MRDRGVEVDRIRFLLRGTLVSSLGLPECFVGIPPKGGAGLGNEFGAAAFDQVSRLGDDTLQDFENLAYAGFPIDGLGC